jgi:hypothetical protein
MLMLTDSRVGDYQREADFVVSVWTTPTASEGGGGPNAVIQNDPAPRRAIPFSQLFNWAHYAADAQATACDFFSAAFTQMLISISV